MPAIRFDTLLVRALAAELAAVLRGARLRAVRFDRPELRVRLVLRMRDGATRTLLFELGGDGAGIRFDDAGPIGGNVPLPRNIRVADVVALPDERVLAIELGAEPRPRLVVELLTNQWNAVAVASDGRILRALRPRRGERAFRPGVEYRPPPSTGRMGVDAPIAPEEWRGLLAAGPAAERARRLVATVAWLSPLNAPWVLGEGETDAAASYERYHELVTSRARPMVLPMPHGGQPYPHPLGRLDARTAPTLLDAFEAAAEESGTRADAASDSLAERAGAAAKARSLAARLRRRAERLRGEVGGATEEAERLRTAADLLLAQLHRVERGASSLTLDDFAGGTREVELDPALSPSDNAQRLYAAARKRQRAADRLPGLIRTADTNAAALERWAGEVEEGRLDASDPPVPLDAVRAARKGEPVAPLLPYRRFRTSGGLEVRVGRSSRSNDELTLRHASPDDIWLHARDVAGAHVVLRWNDAQANPPQRDLAEAAVLAALFSRARTSGVAAVDWTRRKYVRKRRRAASGAVTLERSSTIFVAPDESVAARMTTEP